MGMKEWLNRRQQARTKVRLWLAGTIIGAYIIVAFSSLTLKLVLSVSVSGSNPSATVTEENDDAVIVFLPGKRRHRMEKGGDEERMGVRVRRATYGGNASDEDENVRAIVADASPDNCTPRSVDNFPANFFTLQQTQDGMVFVHILLALYLFAALAIVCDDYFVPALERICDDLGLQEDVAGATFMAAGSSAPELCTSIVGVFIAQSDVGVGTIVGSAVFNILVIIGVCAIFAGMIVDLTWYPLVRDSLFYLLSVLALVLVIEDSRVEWYEALAMILLYALYILLMYFNRRLENRAIEAVGSIKARIKGRGGPVDREEKQSLLAGASTETEEGRGGAMGASGGPQEVETRFGSTGEGADNGESEDSKYESPWEIPEWYPARVYWVAMIPVRALCYLTVPDCRRGGGWRRLYPLTFLLSVVWIGAFTYVMVWMITIAGDALDIPDTVMGLTLLAAGTSLPDCLASLLVARDGYGDMAVSNSIGSNVFDILLCLGLPWLIDTAAVQKGGSLQIGSSGLLYSSLTLLATVLFLLVSIAANKWRLTKPYGALCLLVYVVVITLSSLYELNVFGDLNPPSCPR